MELIPELYHPVEEIPNDPQRELGPEPETILEMVHKLLAKNRDFLITGLPRLLVDKPNFCDDLPARTSAIYCLAHEQKGILYICKAVDVKRRWRADHTADIFHDKLDRAIHLKNVWLYRWAVPRECLAILESLLIQRHRPPWNGCTY